MWTKSESEVQRKIWGRQLSDKELMEFLKSDMEGDSAEAQKHREEKEEFLNRMSIKISKMI
jgi:hypothetical protein